MPILPRERTRPLPSWLKVRLPSGLGYGRVRAQREGDVLHTVCEEARCPNLAGCWESGTATFMILGGSCTRACRFCSVATARRPAPPDPCEPERLAASLAALELRHAVLTTVCRDDLADQGAGHIAACVRAVKERTPGLRIELLVQDFRGDEACLGTVVRSGPDVLAHNLETVERLTPLVRDPRAGYRQSLDALRTVRALDPRLRTKSSLMLGLGETEDELFKAMRDLRDAGVSLLTLGQYLRPGRARRYLPVEEYLPPERFERYGRIARDLGFCKVASGPLVRSSYRAAELCDAK